MSHISDLFLEDLRKCIESQDMFPFNSMERPQDLVPEMTNKRTSVDGSEIPNNHLGYKTDAGALPSTV